MTAARRMGATVARGLVLAMCLCAIALPAAADRKAMQERALRELSEKSRAAQAEAKQEPPAPPPAQAPPVRHEKAGKGTITKAYSGRAADEGDTTVAAGAKPAGAAAKPAVITPDDAAPTGQEPAASLGPGVELITGGNGADGTARIGRLPIIQ